MSDDPFDDAVVTPERLGVAMFLLMVPLFGYLGLVLFDDVAFGGVVGLAVGAGTFVMLPYFMYGQAGAARGIDTAGTDYSARGAAGMALANAGIIALAMRFVFEGAVLLPLAVGALAAVPDYFIMDRVLPSGGEGTAS